MSPNAKYLLKYAPLADFISEMNGPNSEVLIHDLSDLEHSIIYITPQNITKRTIGGTITDYALKMLMEKHHQDSDYVVNYVGYLKSENMILRSSTFFLKENGKLLGLLCLNVDITELVQAKKIIENAIRIDVGELTGDSPRENFNISVEEMIDNIIVPMFEEQLPLYMTVDQKRTIVAELEKRGAFMLKGTIPIVASRLNVSEQTVYRYIKEIQK